MSSFCIFFLKKLAAQNSLCDVASFRGGEVVRFVFFMKNYQGGLNVLFLGVSNIPQWGAGPHLVQNLSKSPIAVGPGEVSCAGGQFNAKKFLLTSTSAVNF